MMQSLLFILILQVTYTQGKLDYSFNLCQNWTFQRRPDMDDLVSTGTMIAELTEITTRAGCFSECVWAAFCNLVLFNPVTNKCRLYSEAFHYQTDGAAESGWQYYGVPCSQHRLENVHPDADILTSDATAMCDDNHFMTSDCQTPVSSCINGLVWEEIDFKCVPDTTHFGTLYPTMSPSTIYTEDLIFNLAPGMKLRLEVEGDDYEYNEVWMEMPNTDIVYLLSLRWLWPAYIDYTVFNTKTAGIFGTEDILNSLPVNNRNDYSIDIHILTNEFKTYADEVLMMTNQMRMPFVDIRRVVLFGFRSVRQFQIGYKLC